MKGFPRARVVAIARETAIVGLFVAAAVIMTWPLLPQARTHIVDVGVDDTLLYTRYARCFRDWLLGREQGYLSFDMYFPSLLSGATDDAALGIAVQALPLAIFIRDYLFTINLITFASFVMCAHATYLLTRELTRTAKSEGSRGAGIVAGLAFAFCFYRMRQLEHPHVLQMQWLPYALYFLHRLANAPTRKNAGLFTLVLFFACTASFNIAIYSAFVFPPVATWLVLSAKKRRFRVIGWLVVACAVVGLSLLVVYRPFFILRDAGGPVREAWEIKMFSSKVESFHAAPAFSKNYGDLSANMSDECATFLGWIVLALASVGIFGASPSGSGPRAALVSARRAWLLLPLGIARAAALTGALLLFAFNALFDDWIQPLFIAGVVAFVLLAALRRILHPTRERGPAAPIYVAVGLCYAALCFGLEITSKNGHVLGPGIWAKIQALPGFEQVRTPSRFFFVSSMCAAVLSGLGANAIANALPGKISRGLWFVVAAFAVLWDVRATPIPIRAMPTIANAPPVYRALAEAPKPGAVVEFPVEFNQRARRGVYYANIHGRPTMNGISGWGLYFFNTVMSAYWVPAGEEKLDSPVGLNSLRAAHVAGLRYAVIHRAEMSQKDRDLYEGGLHALGSVPAGSFGSDDLWELPDPPPSRPPRAQDVAIVFEKIEWRDRAAREIFVWLHLENKTDENLYEPRVKHFSVAVAAAGNVVGSGNGYLFPPLLTPQGVFQIRYRVKLVRRPRPDWVTVTLTDDDGTVWGSTEMHLPD